MRDTAGEVLDYTTATESAGEDERTFDTEPPAFVYAAADNCEGLTFFAHDPLGRDVPGADGLASVKTQLAAGVPSMFGFDGFPCLGKTSVPGGIPFPYPGEQAE